MGFGITKQKQKTMTEKQELLKICKERNELDFLFNITKEIAEADSIAENTLLKCLIMPRSIFVRI